MAGAFIVPGTHGTGFKALDDCHARFSVRLVVFRHSILARQTGGSCVYVRRGSLVQRWWDMIAVMSTRPLALLWDNDGVLVDTERLYFQATCELLASVGATLDEAQYVEFFLRQGTGAWHLARERGLDEVQVAALKVARNARYAELLAAGSLMLPGVASALTILAARYRMAVVTTSATDHFEIIHRSTQLLPHFEFCLTRSDYVRSKPDPEPYRLAVSRLGLAPAECLVIEDSQRGLYAALAAGLRCWIVPSHFTRSEDFTGAERVFPDIAAVAAALCSDGAVDR